jgi:Flp pilus assembly protein TadD
MVSQDGELPAASPAVTAERPAPPTAETPTELTRQARIIEALDQGQLYAAIGRHDVAASHYSEAVRLDPGNAPARYRLALAYVRDGQEAPARREMAALKELDPSLASLLRNLLR